MFRVIIVSIIMAIFSFSQFSYSEEAPDDGKRSNVEYYQISYVKYKTGMADKARAFTKKYYDPVYEATGVPKPFVIYMQTGPWDSVMLWKHGSSMAAFDWVTTPEDEKWVAEFARQNGTLEKGMKLVAEYFSMVDKNVREIGHHPIPPK